MVDFITLEKEPAPDLQYTLIVLDEKKGLSVDLELLLQ